MQIKLKVYCSISFFNKNYNLKYQNIINCNFSYLHTCIHVNVCKNTHKTHIFTFKGCENVHSRRGKNVLFRCIPVAKVGLELTM